MTSAFLPPLQSLVLCLGISLRPQQLCMPSVRRGFSIKIN